MSAGFPGPPWPGASACSGPAGENGPLRRLKIFVTGQVQGVGFRPFVFRLATEAGLSGYVRNTGQGVDMEVQGSSRALRLFQENLRSRLPPLAEITDFLSREIPPIHPDSDRINSCGGSARQGSFAIIASATSGSSREDSPGMLVPPDVGTCTDCLQDLHSPGNRRFAYPFTNCTNCGPRYSIIAALPYDRPATSMACFPLCPDCLAEYNDPANRRFHAQPNACPVCGPQLWLTDAQGRELANGAQAISLLAKGLAAGKIAAIKGLGGFHLACSALFREAVRSLRCRKKRPARPRAVMPADLETARQLARINAAEAAALTGPQAPIVLCAKQTPCPLPLEIAPGLDQIGIILPYTPLHHILLARFAEINHAEGPAALVMTSGNRSGEPIAIGNRQALQDLQDIADLFLLHNRDILMRADDSVLRLEPESGIQFLRRARGYAPLPLAVRLENKALPASGPCTPTSQASALPFVPAGHNAAGVLPPLPAALTDSAPLMQTAALPFPSAMGPGCVLGVGAELKNTICFARRQEHFIHPLSDFAPAPQNSPEPVPGPAAVPGHTSFSDGLFKTGEAGCANGAGFALQAGLKVQGFVSQHLGDLASSGAENFMRETAAHLRSLFGFSPQAVVRDLHPDYFSSRFAEELGADLGIPVLALQHHFAHAFSVLFENNHQGEALALCLDGSGLGKDGTIWGGELIRACTLSGQARRIGHIAPTLTPGGDAAARHPWRMAQAYLYALDEAGREDTWFSREFAQESCLVGQMLKNRLNCPLNTSLGRLFDAVAGLLGFGSCQSGESALFFPGGAMSFEGQAAMWLENLQDRGENNPYPCPLRESEQGLELDTLTLFSAVVQDVQAGLAAGRIARRFHLGLVQGLCALAQAAAQASGLSVIGLSGGVMHNATLSALLPARLQAAGLQPRLHRQLPPGDGCISFGQAVWGMLPGNLEAG